MRRKIRVCAACCGVVLMASLACTRSPESREANYLKRGQAQMAKKDYARAILEFRGAIQAMPKEAEPYYQLGLAFSQSGNLSDAVASFRKATELNPKHTGAQLKLAELMAASRNKELIEQAATRLQDIIAASPDNSEAIDSLAQAELFLGKPEEAAKLLDESLRTFPAHLESSVTLARLKLSRKDMAGAEEVLKKAAASAPQSAPAALALGQFYLQFKQPEKAEPEIRKALQLDPKSAAALVALGAIQLKAGRTSDAEQTYKQVAALPETPYKSLHAVFLFRTGEINPAVAELQKIVRDNPDDRDVRATLLSVFLRLNKIREAQDLLGAALKRNPRDTDALFQQSALYLKSGNVTEADQDLKQVLKFHPDSAEAHLALAHVLRAEGLQHLESEELNETLRLRPDMLEARMALVRNLLVANQPKSAIGLLDQAPGAQKRALPVVTDRIWALLEAGDAKEARVYLDQALRVSRNPQLKLQDAVLKMQQHDFAGARMDAEEALKADPGDVRAARIVVGAYVGLNQQPQALQRLKDMVAFRPKSAPLRHLLGEWYVDTGNLAEARKAFEASRTADPAFLPAELALGEIDLKENRIDAARQRLTGIVKANPNNVSALLLLAAADHAAGDRAAAISRYRSVLDVDSSNVFALGNLAYELAAGNPDEALKFGQRAVELAPDNASVLDTVGWVYYRKGIYNTAVGYLKTAVGKEPTARRQFHLAMSYIKSGQRDLGQKLLVSALQQDPNLTKTEQGW